MERTGVGWRDSLERRKRTQLQRSLSAWDRANYSLPVSDPSISEHARNRKPRSRGRDGDRAQQQRSSVAANPSTTTRPGPVPQRRPPTTLTLDYRSWSGDIRYEEPVFPLTPHLEKLSQAEKDDPLPQSAPKALAQPVPTYCPLGDAHATPTTPPPSYASLFKNAGVPAPRPTQGSRAAVWPSRHPSPVLRIAVALDSQHSRGPAAASLRPIELRAAEEARRIQQNYRILQLRARGPDSSPRVPTSSSSQSSSNRLVLVHSYSYSVVQTVQGHGRSRDRGPTTSPEEGWLPVKERVVPSRADPSRTGPAEASSRVLQADATQLRREMRQLDVRLQTAAARTKQHLKLEQPGHRSRSEGLRVDSERGPTPSGKDVASSNANPRRRGPVVDPW
ncbi:hypothetical protein L226DRAFT_227026 [Lentinus tigrinus ALCF2SS1-7]|uniref:uncharacterized protein n=1 Tax=Lentinus tigrinus ALCF2SS1-7 TaxID=1328758 RepID=UPI001165F801|nr:hypothetical protein L226DRAFT_227026 [Lentinus tigrinus ALCF2SS1-7]